MHATYIDRVASVAFVTLKNKEGQADMGDVGRREQSSVHKNMTEETEVGPEPVWLILRLPCTLDLTAQRAKGRRLGGQRVLPR